MEDLSGHKAAQQIQVRSKGRGQENITVSISDRSIEIKDHLSQRVQVLAPPVSRKLQIETGRGNDIIHVVANGVVTQPVTVSIDARGGHKLIVGAGDPMIQLQVNHANEEDLVLPDPQPATYELYAPKIKAWNESNRSADGFWKRIKRRLVYFFGRDFRLKRPFRVENKLKEWLPILNNRSAATGVLKPVDYTTRQHLNQLEALAKPGDLLLRYQDGYPFDKYFVGVWQHAGLYVKKGTVIDAMGPGTYLRSMDAFGEADGILLLRLRQVSPDQVHLALSYAFEQIGKSYSVDFDDRTMEQYCSGLVIHAYKYAGVLPTDYRKNEVIHPDDLLKLPHLEIIWTNREDLLQESLRHNRRWV